MTKYIAKKISFAAAALFICSAPFVSADTVPPPTTIDVSNPCSAPVMATGPSTQASPCGTTAAPAVQTSAPAPIPYTPVSGTSTANILGLNGATQNLAAFLGAVYNFGIAAAVALTVIMLIWGGIELMTTESFTGKSDAKARMKNAVLGLLLAVLSYLILYIINPCLVDFIGQKGCKNPNTLLKPTSGISVRTDS